MVTLVYIASLRDAVRPGLIEALLSNGELEATDDASAADVVLFDATLEMDARAAEATNRSSSEALKIILSVALSPDATDWRLVVSQEEQSLVSTLRGPWLILRCAPIGQELHESLRYFYNETIFTSWARDGAAWLDVNDLVAVMVEAVNDETRRKIAYDLTGPEILSMDYVCELIEKKIGSPVFYVELEQEQHVQAMVRVGRSESYARRRAEHMRLSTGLGQASPNDTVLRALGREPRGLEEYLLDPVPEIIDQSRKQWG